MFKYFKKGKFILVSIPFLLIIFIGCYKTFIDKSAAIPPPPSLKLWRVIRLDTLMESAKTIFGFRIYPRANQQSSAEANKKQNQICFKNDCFSVELAQTIEEQAHGLMFRESLKSDEGMLFIFQNETKHSFWMKNTLVPLDIIWIDGSQKVVFINKNTLPCQIKECQAIDPMENAKYVLELNSGIADKIGLSVGDEMNIDLK